MKFLSKLALITLASAGCFQLALANNITGAGSTFIYPVFSLWTAQYYKETGNKINYQPIGSGGGIRQIKAKTVDLAASDMPLTLAQLKKSQLMQFPMIVGGIVPIVHIAGIKPNGLVLNGPVLAEIYGGEIKNWDNPQIKALNPQVALPHSPIITIHRADGSGTTFNFTHYLAQVSPSWKAKIGVGTVVNWQGMGTQGNIALGAKGNAGVASQVQSLPNSIGYVEYAYALQSHLVTVALKNKAGKIVKASGESFAMAAKNAPWKASNGFYLVLTNQPGDNTWPIVASTFILMPKTSNEAKAAFAFFTWCYTQGQTMAKQLDYVPIPKMVYKQIEKSW